MKKIIAVLLTLTLVFALAACGGKAGNGEERYQLVSEGKLTMATNAAFSPYEYKEGGEVVGIDADIAKAIADKLGLELVIEDMEFESVVPSVQSGKADMAMAALTILEERLLVVDMTTSYCTGVQVIIVPENSPITCNDDLFGDGNYKIGAQLATTGDLYCTWDIEDEGLGTVERYATGADAVMALTTGKVDCVVIDNEPAKVFVKQNEGLKILDTAYAEEDYSIAVGKNNTKLCNDIDTAIKELIADGTVKTILSKYIAAE